MYLLHFVTTLVNIAYDRDGRRAVAAAPNIKGVALLYEKHCNTVVIDRYGYGSSTSRTNSFPSISAAIKLYHNNNNKISLTRVKTSRPVITIALLRVW